MIDEEMGVVVVKVKDVLHDSMTMHRILDQLNNAILPYSMQYHVEQVETLLIDLELVIAGADHL